MILIIFQSEWIVLVMVNRLHHLNLILVTLELVTLDLQFLVVNLPHLLLVTHQWQGTIPWMLTWKWNAW